MKEKPFWILWQPESNLPPRVRFDTYAEAQGVAETMARRLGKRLYIAKAEAYAEPAAAPVKTTSLR